MITIGIMGVVAYFIVELLKVGTMGQKTLQAQDDSRVLTDNITTLLSDPIACENTFGGLSMSPNPKINPNPSVGPSPTINFIVDGNFNKVFETGSTYGNKSLQLNQIQIGGPTGAVDAKTGIPLWTSMTPTSGTAFVQMTWQQTGSANNQLGPGKLVRYFILNVTGLNGGYIATCKAQAVGASPSYWSLNAANNIFNSNNGGTGFVGIGVNNPTSMLQVAGNITPSATGSYSLGDSTHLFTEVFASNGTINTSDRREKTDIIPSDLGLDFISKLRPVSYHWRTGIDANLHYGLIAQDTEEAILEEKQLKGEESASNTIVVHDKKSDRYGLNYSELISPIVQAIQELSRSEAQEITTLKSENAAMKAWICQHDHAASFCVSH